MVKVLIKKLNSKVKLPEYKTSGSSGMDVMAFTDNPIRITPNTLKIIPIETLVSKEYAQKRFEEIDFSALLETVSNQAGLKLVSEGKDVKTGLETKED